MRMRFGQRHGPWALAGSRAPLWCGSTPFIYMTSAQAHVHVAPLPLTPTSPCTAACLREASLAYRPISLHLSNEHRVVQPALAVATDTMHGAVLELLCCCSSSLAASCLLTERALAAMGGGVRGAGMCMWARFWAIVSEGQDCGRQLDVGMCRGAGKDIRSSARLIGSCCSCAVQNL